MTFQARQVASFDDEISLVDAASVSGHKVWAFWLDGAVRLVDSCLNEIQVRSVKLPSEPKLLAARGLKHLVFATENTFLLIGKKSVTITDVACDSAAFLGDYIIATAPSDDGHRLLLVCPVTGQILEEMLVDAAEYAVASITVHPKDPVAVIDLAMGQDGVLVLRVDIDHTQTSPRLVVTEIFADEEVAVAGFDAAGGRLLVAPYPNAPEGVRVFEWSSPKELGRLSAQQFGIEWGFDFEAC